MKVYMAFITPRYLPPVPLLTPGTMTPFLGPTHTKKKKKEKKRLHSLSFAAKASKTTNI